MPWICRNHSTADGNCLCGEQNIGIQTGIPGSWRALKTSIARNAGGLMPHRCRHWPVIAEFASGLVVGNKGSWFRQDRFKITFVTKLDSVLIGEFAL